MLHFLVSVCETLLPVTMMLGVLLGFARQRQLFEVRAPAKYGFILGFVVAAVLAGLKLTTGFIVREYYSLAVLTVMVPFELLLVLLLVRRRHLASEQAASVGMRCIFFVVAASWAAYYLPDIFIYPSHFAVGVVQVVSSDFVFIVVGYLAGLVLCALISSMAFKVSADVPLDRLFPLLLALLAVFIVQQLVVIGQILVGRGIFPRYDWALDAIIFLLNHTREMIVALVVLSAALGMILWILSCRQTVTGDNPAQRRKSRHLIDVRIRRSRIYLVLLLAGLLVATVGYYFDNKKVELTPPQEVVVEDGKIRLPLAMVNDGHLHRFVYHGSEGVDVRYIVIKKSETSYGVGLDACDVCGASGGYYERKGQVVCILCDVVMNKSTIGFAGGCNPVPLDFTIEEGNLVIDTESLEEEQSRFY